MELHVVGPAWGLPTADPACLAVLVSRDGCDVAAARANALFLFDVAPISAMPLYSQAYFRFRKVPAFHVCTDLLTINQTGG